MEEKLTNEPMEAAADTGAENKPCFDDILSDKEYQSEFDRRVAKAIETAKAKWTDDKQEATLAEANKRADALEAEVDRYKKRETAMNLGVAGDMLDYAVFTAQKHTSDEVDFETALKTVIANQAWLTVTTLPTTGIPQTQTAQGKSGVERAFVNLNPKIKI